MVSYMNTLENCFPKELNLSSWKGETVSFRYELQNGSGTNVAVRPQFSAVPKDWIVKAGVLREAKYTVTPYSDEVKTAYDRVEWNGSVSIAAGAKVLAVGSISIPTNAEAGDYELKFGDAVVKMHVADMVLPEPKNWKYNMNMWHNPYSIARLTNTKLWSDEHFEAMKPFMAFTAAWGQKGIVCALSDYPWDHQCYDGYTTMIRHIKNPLTGKWTFDYSVFDKWVEFNFATGNGKNIECYSLCPWGYAVYWEDPTGHPNRITPKPGTEEFEEYWTPFLLDFAEHLKSKGWFEKAVMNFDERDPEDIKNIVAYLKRVAPEFRVHAASNMKPDEYDGAVTPEFTQAFWEITPKFLDACHKRRAAGKRSGYTYVCCFPPKPNNFVWSDPDDNFWIQVFPIAHGMMGSPRWTIDSWNRDPMNDLSYYGWPASDAFFIYPDASPSIRYLEILNGVQNGEKWRILYDELKVKREELDELAEKYDVQKALNKNDGDFHEVVEETLRLLNY